MRIFSYRNKRALRRALLIALLAVVLIGLLILARISYLGRYAVYSPDGVYSAASIRLWSILPKEMSAIWSALTPAASISASTRQSGSSIS